MSYVCLVDTNVLVRYFTGEPADMAQRARAIIGDADRGKIDLEVPSPIVAETLFTLESYYEIEKAEICEKLLLFLRSRGITPQEPQIIFDALERYRSLPVRFAEAYLAAQAAARKIPVYSFDQDFARFRDVGWKR